MVWNVVGRYMLTGFFAFFEISTYFPTLVPRRSSFFEKF
jgi:hypothetical protein